jgi:PleD family two-component response regulator
VIAGSAVPRGRGKKRLLVIDDEQSICEFVRRVAEAEGFEVVTAVTHAQFKSAYESFPASPCSRTSPRGTALRN